VLVTKHNFYRASEILNFKQNKIKTPSYSMIYYLQDFYLCLFVVIMCLIYIFVNRELQTLVVVLLFALQNINNELSV
jgi:hypothetical protein